MDPVDIIKKYYDPAEKSFKILLRHGRQVANKSVEIAGKVKHLSPDIDFIKEAAMLHDIGIFMTNTPFLGCYGMHPYICHGYLGRVLLEGIGLSKHALICERHVGVGITAEDIRRQHLPLPLRDMVPVSIEEKIICYADNFFCKSNTNKERSIEDIKQGLNRFGHDKVVKFQSWADMFE